MIMTIAKKTFRAADFVIRSSFKTSYFLFVLGTATRMAPHTLVDSNAEWSEMSFGFDWGRCNLSCGLGVDTIRA
jgi:hypothetical protein